MAGQIATLLRAVRSNLKEPIPVFWTDQELLTYMNAGAQDLWRAITDLYEHHFSRVVETPFIEANTSTVSGVPTDCYKVVLIEPRVIGAASVNPSLIFKPMDWTDPRFQNARAGRAHASRDGIIYYTLFGPGAPEEAPQIRIGPQLSDAVLLSLTYNYTLPWFDETDTNPIPGMADHALIAWTTAYARAKEREDGAPDMVWLNIYGTEKVNLIKQLPPRQVQEPDMVYGMFEGWGPGDWD